MTDPFDALGSPVRRRILELLASGEAAAGELTRVARAEFGISQPAVSQHLRVLRDGGLVSVRALGARRVYRVEPGFVEALDRWLAPFRTLDIPLEARLDALATEIARGKRDRRIGARRAAEKLDSA